MSSLVEFAEQELARIGGQDDSMQLLMNKNVLDIVKMFSNQGHSGFSAGYAIAQIRRLLNWKPLTPLTGEEDEWNGNQNKRYSAVFREDGKAYNIEGKIFTDDGGQTWWQGSESRVPITFPYNVPDSPIRVYRYIFKGESIEAPEGIEWTDVHYEEDELHVVGEFNGNPSEMATYRVVENAGILEIMRVS